MFTLTPAACAASQLMSKGLTLSQLYAEHLTATDKLLKIEEENTRLTRYIDQILQVSECSLSADLLKRRASAAISVTLILSMAMCS